MIDESNSRALIDELETLRLRDEAPVKSNVEQQLENRLTIRATSDRMFAEQLKKFGPMPTKVRLVRKGR